MFKKFRSQIASQMNVDEDKITHRHEPGGGPEGRLLDVWN